jgi:hypothetical protein
MNLLRPSVKLLGMVVAAAAAAVAVDAQQSR